MKRLLFLTMITVAAAGALGCRSRGAACRPCVPAPVCGGVPVESYTTQGYTTQGVITTQQVPSLAPTTTTTVPGQVIPGPETYAPSMP